MRELARSLLVLAALVSMGCTGQLRRGGTAGTSPCSFWPPPPSTSIATADAIGLAPEPTLADAAAHLARALRDGGYDPPRFYPVGVDYRHGFATTTRLETIDGEGRPVAAHRWSALYPDASTLRWLEGARRPRLPGPGNYRVFLIAFTDLPIGRSQIAPVWNDDTVMEGPGVPGDISPSQMPARRASSRFRFGFYVYEYGSDADHKPGELLPANAERSAASHVRAARLDNVAGPTSEADPPLSLQPD